jgi:DNA repair exonuclease SbcCD ATPase subunit
MRELAEAESRNRELSKIVSDLQRELKKEQDALAAVQDSAVAAEAEQEEVKQARAALAECQAEHADLTKRLTRAEKQAARERDAVEQALGSFFYG